MIRRTATDGDFAPRFDVLIAAILYICVASDVARLLRCDMNSLNPEFEIPLCVGELYLFHATDPQCPAESSLWGVYDRSEDGTVYLEHSTTDNLHFRMWKPLPEHYRYCRLATRRELRDYMYNLGIFDSNHHSTPAISGVLR